MLLGVGALTAAPTLIGLALLQVRIPAHVVDIERGTSGIKMEDPVDGVLQQCDVMRDHDEPALVRSQELAQPGDGVRIQVIGWLVEQQRLSAAEQDAGQLNPAALPTRQRPQRLSENALGQAEARGDRRRFRLGGIAPAGQKLLVQAAIARHRPIPSEIIGAGHRAFVVPHSAHDLVEATRREDPVASKDAEVPRTRILRQVSHRTRADDPTGSRLALAGKDPGQRRLAGPIATNQPHPVTGAHPERRMLEQEAGPRAKLNVGGGYHGRPSVARDNSVVRPQSIRQRGGGEPGKAF